MVMCCPKCHGMIHAGKNPEDDWSCEDCNWKGPYPKLTQEKAAKLSELVKRSN
jgi:hypothetical protein